MIPQCGIRKKCTTVCPLSRLQHRRKRLSSSKYCKVVMSGLFSKTHGKCHILRREPQFKKFSLDGATRVEFELFGWTDRHDFLLSNVEWNTLRNRARRHLQSCLLYTSPSPRDRQK